MGASAMKTAVYLYIYTFFRVLIVYYVRKGVELLEIQLRPKWNIYLVAQLFMHAGSPGRLAGVC